jgi:hypothetical protein
VIAAFTAGWALAELFDGASEFLATTRPPGPKAAPALGAHPAPHPKPALADHLAGVGEMDPKARAAVLAGRAAVALDVLGSAVIAPPLAAVNAAIGLPAADAASSTAAIAELQTALKALHRFIQQQLAIHDPVANTAYGLGRMLADTALLPRLHTPEQFDYSLDPYRLGNADEWLRDLDEAFPSGAAAAVRYSLDVWSEWLVAARDGDKVITQAKITQQIVQNLRSQGRIWQRLLTGQMAPSSLLEPESYVDAANAMLTESWSIAKRFARTWWWILALVVGLIAGGVLGAIFLPGATAKSVALVGSVLGALGLSWKGVGSTLGGTLTKAESELWRVEVANATGAAATIAPVRPPDTARLRGRVIAATHPHRSVPVGGSVGGPVGRPVPAAGSTAAGGVAVSAGGSGGAAHRRRANGPQAVDVGPRSAAPDSRGG